MDDEARQIEIGTSRGSDGWGWRCWTCGWRGVGHYSEHMARREADRHVTSGQHAEAMARLPGEVSDRG